MCEKVHFGVSEMSGAIYYWEGESVAYRAIHCIIDVHYCCLHLVKLMIIIIVEKCCVV